MKKTEERMMAVEKKKMAEKVKVCLERLGDFLSTKQKEVVERILDTIASFIVVLGLAGTGKSRLIDGMIKVLKMLGKHYILLSTTGISALLHEEEMAQTVHQGISNSAHQVESKCYSVTPTPLFYLADVIIIDELSMLTPKLWAAIIHYKRSSQKLVLLGDLHQLPPVIPGLKLNKLNTFSRMLFGFMDMDDVECIELTENQRFIGADGLVHSEIMKRIACEGYFKELENYFSKDYICKGDNPQEKESLMEEIRIKVVTSAERQENIPIIVSTNLKANEYNDRVVRRTFADSEFHEYETQYTEYGIDDEASNKQLEAIKELINDKQQYTKAVKELKDLIKEAKKNTDREVFPLRLCVGMKVMITANESVKLGEKRRYANGSIGTIVDLDKESVEVKLWGKDGSIVKIPAVKTEHEVYMELDDEMIVYRYATTVNFPIIIGYAFTVHKVQGMTVDEAFIDPEGCFEDGQFYTMISRVRTREGVHLLRRVKAKEVKASVHVKAFYNYLERSGGKMYDRTITNLLKDRFKELDRLDQLYEANRHYIKFNRLSRDKYVDYRECYEGLSVNTLRTILDNMAFINELYEDNPSYLDPRIIYVLARLVELGEKDCVDVWVDGRLEGFFKRYTKYFPIVKVPDIPLTKEEAVRLSEEQERKRKEGQELIIPEWDE